MGAGVRADGARLPLILELGSSETPRKCFGDTGAYSSCPWWRRYYHVTAVAAVETGTFP